MSARRRRPVQHHDFVNKPQSAPFTPLPQDGMKYGRTSCRVNRDLINIQHQRVPALGRRADGKSNWPF